MRSYIMFGASAVSAVVAGGLYWRESRRNKEKGLVDESDGLPNLRGQFSDTVLLNCGEDATICGLNGNKLGVLACNRKTSFMSRDTWNSWFGEGSGEEESDTATTLMVKELPVETICVDPKKAPRGGKCGVCPADMAPTVCTQCSCTVKNGPMEGQAGFWMSKTSMFYIHDHAICVPSERSVTMQLESESVSTGLYGVYSCLEDPCPAP
eukprot:CAMPEP_0194029038 /NCGR_PEP_ID=MMETSP0009_2-20130614/2894_1 /TAXON_ID=210454 /ORGANISM="Grammatophora oceanica, Strain CCMP 410" /LENGTH=208 /DNA_ID=CAMNT_0038668617 /DNA_START=46 /DNA_END=672 /DNA_ORIENTATION=-